MLIVVIQKQLGFAATSLSQPNTPGIASKPRHTDTSSRQRSASPVIRSSHSGSAPNDAPTTSFPKKPSHRHTSSIAPSQTQQNYVNSATQTDGPQELCWYEPTISLKTVPRRYISWKQRLLNRCQRDRERFEAQSKIKSSAGLIFHDQLNKEPAPSDSIVVATANESKDSEMPDAECERTSDIGLSPSNAPVQKPRPPDEVHIDPGSVTVTETKPPLPRLLPQSEQPSTTHSRSINGYRHPDLRVLLPPTPPLSNEPALDSSTIVTPVSTSIRSPLAQSSNNHPSVLTNNISTLIQPSPVKKKISLEEYKKRVGNIKTEVLLTPEKTISGSPVASQNVSKIASLDGEVKISSAESGSAVDGHNREEHDSIGMVKDPKL